MYLRKFGLTCLNGVPRALGAGLLCCALIGGAVHAQAPQQGTAAVPAAPAASAPPAPAGVAPTPAAGGVAQPQGETAVPPAMDVAPGTLPRDLSPWGMFMSADIVVKAVMIGLVFASVLTWTIWLAKTLELIGARRRLARAHEVLAAARSLAEAAKPASDASPQVGRLIAAVEAELRRSPDRRDIDGIKERIAARFERISRPGSVGRCSAAPASSPPSAPPRPSSACSARYGAS